MKKRISVLFLALSLCFTLAQPALAQEPAEAFDTTKTTEETADPGEKGHSKASLPATCDYINGSVDENN